MNRIDKKFRELKLRRKKAFIPYITAGDPGIAATGRLVAELERAGADIIELGIPFSDPIADGPTIQAASYRALRKGASLAKIFDMMRSLRKKTDIPVAFMTYYNPVLRYGLDRFFASCRRCGVDGVIIPDLPVEESSDIAKLGKKSGVKTIFLVAPTSTKDRVRDIAGKSSGFVYYVSSTGVTGARKRLSEDIAKNVRLIRSAADKPVAVGFGVSDEKQARLVARASDGVIVGSAIVKIIGAHGDYLRKVYSFAKKLAGAVHDDKTTG